jgi:hypothetical protein
LDGKNDKNNKNKATVMRLIKFYNFVMQSRGFAKPGFEPGRVGTPLEPTWGIPMRGYCLWSILVMHPKYYLWSNYNHYMGRLIHDLHSMIYTCGLVIVGEGAMKSSDESINKR